MPRTVRAAFSALWALDLAFADVVSTSSDPRLGAIGLAWWRERLEELDEGGEPPAEPRLQIVARELLPRGVTGKELSQLEDAWLPLLEPFPWGDAQAQGLAHRGRILFGSGARLLGSEAEAAEAAGELWSLLDGERHCSDARSRNALLAHARRLAPPEKSPRKLRSLTVLTALAVPAVLNPASGLARGTAAARHRLTGRIPKL